MQRRKTREIKIGKVKIGNNNQIAIQSMCNTKTSDIKATINQIKELEKAGCEIVRVSVPDQESVNALKQIKQHISIPIVADIHFDHKLAIQAAQYVDKLRINPGNIGNEENIKQVINAAKQYNIPIRIGVNLGSLEKHIEEKFGRTSKAMVESALYNINLLEKHNFNNIIISMKASDVKTTIKAYKQLSEKVDYPLHLGITEAGTYNIGVIKSSVGIGSLLAQGIGDTIRVSLTDNPVKEVEVGIEILKSLGLKQGREIISCPTCARTSVNLIPIANEIEKRTANIKAPIKIAIMGCEVNGPGEAKNADIGIAFSKGKGFIFKKGEIIKTVEKDNAVKEFLEEINKI